MFMVPVIVGEYEVLFISLLRNHTKFRYICPIKAMDRSYSPIGHSIPSLTPIEVQFKRTIVL